MDDFLHNLRSGKLKQSDRGGRRDFSDYKGPQRRTGSDRRRPDYYAKVTQENFALVKDSLDAMAEQQSRIADALESIATLLGGQVKSVDRQPAASPEAEVKAAVQSDDAGDAEWGAKLDEENRERAARLIGEMRQTGQSWEKIARHMIDQGVPTVSGKGLWRGPAVKKFWEAHA